MAPERKIGIVDQSTLLLEGIFGNKADLRVLQAGGPNKNIIIQKAVSDLGNDVVEQASFLERIFQNLAEEGDKDITNRRDGSMAILTDTSSTGEVRLNTVIAPLIKRNFKVVQDAYIKAVGKQDKTRDPFFGSIAVLLEFGRVIVSHLSQNLQGAKEVISAWEDVKEKGRFERDGELHIGSQIENIKDAVPLALLEPQAKENSSSGGIAKGEKESRSKEEISDERMIRLKEEIAQLRNEGIKNIVIAEKLGIRKLDVEYIIRKLLREEKPRIKPRPGGRLVSKKIIERDKRVEQLRNLGLTNTQIAKGLEIDRKLVEESASRLLKEGRILRASKGRGKRIEKLAS